jgi:predicted nucleic acid-binding protein
MQFVVDANIIFSALIKDSTTRKLISEPKLSLYAPKFFVEEFLGHLWELKEKINTDETHLKEKLNDFIMKNIKLITNEEISEYIQEAEKICPDKGDIAYFALALKLNCAIWSNDSKLKNQSAIKIYSTKEIINLLN